MIRMYAVSNAATAITYYSKSDGLYAASDLRQEWLGKGAELLGLSGKPDFEHFKRLIHGLDPHSDDQLTSRLIDHRIPAWDVTAGVPKGVTVALERGDSRIQEVIWDAARETMSDLEGYATTRVGKGGMQDDRETGNLVAFAVEHPETRPAKADNYPDPDRHIHLVVMNVTYDKTEHEWKAVKFRPVIELRKYFDRRFDARLAHKLTELGYWIETKYKATDEGRRYVSWDIRGMPDSVVKKFSRRTAEVEALAEKLGVSNPQSRDKLGATSRQFKRQDLTLADYRRYWDGRVTPDEARGVAEVIQSAMLGQNPPPENTAEQAVAYALRYTLERQSVARQTDLEITAMETGDGRREAGRDPPGATPSGRAAEERGRLNTGGAGGGAEEHRVCQRRAGDVSSDGQRAGFPTQQPGAWLRSISLECPAFTCSAQPA